MAQCRMAAIRSVMDFTHVMFPPQPD